MNQHFFQFPFAVNGDLAAVPQVSQVSGSVSYQSGYPFDYERDIDTDPAALPIERTKMNQILNDVTTALQQYQVMGIPEWIDATDNGGVSFPYAKFASVVFNGVCYVSQVANNTSTPGTDANWIVRPTTKNAPNLLFNSSAELATAGWTSSNFSPMTGGFGEGTFWENLAAIPNVTTMDTSQQIAIGAGVALSLQAEIFAVGVTAGVGHVTVEAFTAANASLGIVASATAVNGQGWTFHSGSGTTPANTAYVLVHRAADTNPIVSINGLGFRRIKLEVGTLPSIYSQEADISAVPMPVVGSVRNLQIIVGAASSTATLTADEIIVETALGGFGYKLTNVNKTINLATVGAGGMDTGTAPVGGFVAVYAIYNPTTKTSALLATNAATLQPNVYGGANMPAGYTASALVSVWLTNASSQFIVGFQTDRRVHISNATILSTTTAATTFTNLSILGVVPLNARSISGVMESAFTVTAGTSLAVSLATFAVGMVGVGVQQATVGGAAGTINNIASTFTDLAINTGGNIAYTFTTAGGTGMGTTVQVNGYIF